MELIFIGSGSAFTVGSDNYQSNMILEINKKRLLIDCGSDARLALYKLNFSYRDIDAVYISHLHADHCGGLEWLGFCTKFEPKCSKPSLFIHPDLKNPLWKMLSVGMITSQTPHTDLSTYFEVHLIQNDLFTWEGIPITIFPTKHIQLINGYMPSFGLQLQPEGKRILITTDTQFDSNLHSLYQNADIIFQDCETSVNKSGVHAHYTDLRTLNPDIKRKMWLYHYQPLPLPDAKADGFKGFVTRGQRFYLT